MNEFTKEELKELLIFIDGGIRHNNHAVELRNKVNHMIKNYCEHDFRIKKDSNHLYCLKCQRYFAVNGIH